VVANTGATWTAGSPTRPRWREAAEEGAALLAGLVAAQAVLFMAHFALPPPEAGGGAMIERFFLWQVLNLLEQPRGGPLGVVMSALVVAWLVAPARARRSAVVAAAAGAVVVAVIAGHALTTGAPVSPALALSLHYPLDMFWHLAGEHPVMVTVALGLLVARLCDLGGDWPPRERAAHLAWVGWVLWFGVIESGITINYLLLPTVAMMAAIGLDVVALGQQAAAIWPGPRAQVMRAALTGVALLVVADQWSGTGPLPGRLAAARSTIDVTGIAAVRASPMHGWRSTTSFASASWYGAVVTPWACTPVRPPSPHSARSSRPVAMAARRGGCWWWTSTRTTRSGLRLRGCRGRWPPRD